MAHALSHWVNVDSPELKGLRDAALALGDWPTSPHPEDAVPGNLSELNAAQGEAATAVWSRAPLTILHGPPGTGKTRTLVTAMAGLVEAGEKVLATAPSNMAVDVLVERLSEAGLRAVRVGHPMRVSERVL